METFFEAKPGLVSQSAIALGFFDGVHPGHKAVIGSAIAEAKRLGIASGVVTFRDHPRLLTQGAPPLLLTVIEQRLAQFEQLGVDVALVLSFDEALCRLTPREYVENILVGSMGARSISVGYNHHFGRDREGNADLLKALGQELGFGVHVAEAVSVDGAEVSSSRIRELIFAGELAQANKLLARPYAVFGSVARGDGRGQKIGFATANLIPYEFQVVPKIGVYVGLVDLGENIIHPAVINVGYRPTFADASSKDKPVIEAHLLDFKGDLYQDKIDLSFCQFLRPEMKFENAEALQKQIASDIEQAKSFLSQTTKTSALSH